MFFWDSPCGMYIRMEMIGFRCLARTHTSSFCPSLCPRRAYPQQFLGHVGKTPLSPTLTWRRFQMPSRRVVKNHLYSTDAYRCLLVLNTTPISPPLLPSLTLHAEYVIPILPRHSWHPTYVPGAVSFVLHPRDEIVPEKMNIGGNPNAILA